MARAARSTIMPITRGDLARLRRVDAAGAAIDAMIATIRGEIAALHIPDLSQRIGLLELDGTGTDAMIAALAARATALENGLAILSQAVAALPIASLAAAQAALTERMASAEALLALLPKFVAPAPMTVAALRAAYPPANHLGRYAQVTDLFGELRTTMIAEGSAASAYWRPTRQDFAKTITMGDMGLTPTLYALTSAPTLRVTGNASGNVNVTLSPDGAWPGAKRTIVQSGTLGLFSFRILGLALGSVLGMLAGSRATFEFDGSNWWQSA